MGGIFSSGDNQITSNNNNSVNFNPTFSVGSSGGTLLPNNTSSFSYPTYQTPYIRDDMSLSASADLHAKANLAADGGAITDNGPMAKTSGYSTGGVQPDTNAGLFSAATSAGISPMFMWIGGFVLLLMLFKKR